MTMKKEEKTVLDDLVRAFYYNKSQKESFGALADNENAQIKEIMYKNGLDTHQIGDLTAKFSIRRDEKMNEDKLLKLLKDNGLQSCIKTVEIVDMDELENQLYHDAIPQNIVKKMDSCKVVKEIQVLKVSRKD